MQSTSNGHQIRGIKRTICIGLGGTGRDVLMRIRRLAIDQYGSLDRLPVLRFVHIDTDKASTQGSNLSTGNSYHGQSLSFKSNETVTATMSAPEVDNFVRGLKSGFTDDRRSPYDNIGLWFPPRLLDNIKAIEEGAKGIRPVGRLAFFHKYRDIQAAIAQAERLTRTAPPDFIKAGLRIEPGLNIFVVGSLCGGTGSGMFLDIGFSLRCQYGDQEGAQIVSYLVVSPKLYGDTPNMNANTYAALKELDYYSAPGTRFQACYDMQNMVLVDENRPPFDYTYLVSNQTQSEYTIFSQSKLCNVIAQKISLDFSSELGSIVRGTRDNFLQYMISYDSHPRPNVQRYLTFGLAAIYFPRDAIAQIVLMQISHRLLSYWLDGEGQSPDPAKLLHDFLIQRNWREDIAQKDNFTARIKESAREANNTFSRNLSNWKNDIEKRINDAEDSNARRALLQQIPRDLRAQFRSVQYSEIERDRGAWLTSLNQARLNLESQFKQDIDRYLEELLTPGSPYFSIKNARDWLEAMQTDFQENQRNLQDQISESNGFKTLEDLEKVWRDAEEIIGEQENKWKFPFGLPFGGNQRQFGTDIKTAIDRIRGILTHNFDLAATREALRINDFLQKYVQERSVQLAAFDRLVDNVRADYDRQAKELKQLNPDEMSGEAIFDPSEVSGYQNRLVPPQRSSGQLASLSLEVIEQPNISKSLMGLIDQDRPTKERLQTEISFAIDRLFGSRGSEVESVIKQFIQTYSSEEREYRLTQILDEAQPLLRLNLTDPYFRNDIAKKTRLIGFQDVDEIEVKQFKTLLTQNLSILNNELHPTQAADKILFVTEYAGFPLRLMRGLELMRLAYLRERDVIGAFLHIQPADQLMDVIPPDAERLEALEDIFYPCLAFSFITENPQTRQLEFPYMTSDFREIWETFSLSPFWNKAIEELANLPPMAEILRNHIDGIISKIRTEPELLETEYLPKLRDFVNAVDKFSDSHPNFSCRATVVGTPMTRDFISKEGVIDRFVRRIKKQTQPSLPGA